MMTFAIAVTACALLLLVVIAALAMLALNGEKPHGSHARGPRPQDEADPFADPDEKAGPDEAADEYITELRGTGETEPAPVLAAPVAALEPPPLDRREMSAMPARTAAGMTLPLWEPPADRGTLESIRDALRAWTPAPAVPQEPEAEPEPEPWCDPHGENTQQIFKRLVGGQWNVAAMADDIERSVYGSIAAENGGDEKGDFAGASLPGLPDEDRDLPQPVHEAAR